MKIRKEDERMMKKRIKTGGALILAAVLAISAFALNNTFAANGVEAGRTDCTLTVALTAESLFKEVREKEVTVNLFRVADIAVTGKYTVLDEYKEVLNLSDIGPDLKANKWEEKALAVQTLIDTVNKDQNTENDITPITKKAASKIEFTGLSTGMYLVYAENLVTDYYEYVFTPYLISVPTNYWNWSAENQTDMSDKWDYDPIVSLKPQKFDRYGDLAINKKLTSYNETVGGATFVFEVQAVKTDIDTKTETVVYNDVVSMTFDKPGTEQVLIKNIEAGAVVTVTEVYSGASYQVIPGTHSAEETKIVAKDVVAVSFANESNEGLNGGTGLVNTFTMAGENDFTHNKTTDSADNIIIAKQLSE